MHNQSKFKTRPCLMGRRSSKKSTPPKLKPHRDARRSVRSPGRCTVDPGAVFRDLLPDLAENGSGFGWACCPFHDDGRPSFCVNTQSGWYRCASTSCGATGSNIVSFVGRLLGLSFADARKHLEASYA